MKSCVSTRSSLPRTSHSSTILTRGSCSSRLQDTLSQLSEVWRQQSTPLRFPNVLCSITKPQEFISEALAMCLLGESLTKGSWDIHPSLQGRHRLCGAAEARLRPAGSCSDCVCPSAPRREPCVDSPKPYPDHSHEGTVLAARPASGCELNKENRKYIHDGVQVTQ